MIVHIDVETYCELDIRKTGAFRYCSDPSFEVIIFAYWTPDSLDIEVLDCTIPEEKEEAGRIYRAATVIHAHNAIFERLACTAMWGETDATFECSLVKASYVGLPLALGQVAEALELEVQKDNKGTSFIRYFSAPCKPTKANGMRTRNLPEHDFEKWQSFKAYCATDVAVEMRISETLKDTVLPPKEQSMYDLDTRINSRGVRVDIQMVKKAIELDKYHRGELMARAREISGLSNPNSVAQLIDWFNANIGDEIEGGYYDKLEITKLRKADVSELLEQVGEGDVQEMLEIRQQLSKSSVKKYAAIIHAASRSDSRVRGLFQFYGARTARWAGRLVQMQNLPRGMFGDDDLATFRHDLKTMTAEGFAMTYDNIGDILSSLIRSAFVPSKGKRLYVADLSAIEARVLAWIAKEDWRMDVFNSHGMIYEASASKMFKVPLEEVSKEMRSKGKVAELALGYQGGVGAMLAFGADKMGMTPKEMLATVSAWRKDSPNIVRFWGRVEEVFLTAIKTKRKTNWHLFTLEIVVYSPTFRVLSVTLPSGRELNYANPAIEKGKMVYWGLDDRKKWAKIPTYGGKITENLVQAIARDILVEGLLRSQNLDLVLHVHDEIGAEGYPDSDTLQELERNMSEPIYWAEGLPLGAEGFVTDFYKK